MSQGILLLLHYLLPVGIAASLMTVRYRVEARVPSSSGAILFLAAVGAAYMVDRWIDRGEATAPAWVDATIKGAAVVFCALFAILLSQLGLVAWVTTAVLTALCLGYPWLKRFPLMKTAIVSVAWVWGSAVLPYPEHEGPGWEWWSSPLTLPLLLLIGAGTILCDLKDLRRDRTSKVQSLPVMIGARRTCLLATGLALAALPLSGTPPFLALTALLLAVVAQFPALLSKEAVGPMMVDALLILPGVLNALSALGSLA